MTRLNIRKSGGANIVSIPKAILKALDLHEGSELELSLEDNKIILTAAKEELTLDAVLKGSPKKRLKATQEDMDWIDDSRKGKEAF